MYEWANEMNCAVTVCDTKGIILYMNEKACRTFAKHGDLIGKNLFDCHNPQSQAKIRELLETGGVNAYTIEKNGIRKMIYQTAWKQDGVVCGLVEIPCVYRNVGGVSQAFAAAQLALSGVSCPIPGDEVILTMKDVGDALPASLRETGEGGCAGCRSMQIKNP